MTPSDGHLLDLTEGYVSHGKDYTRFASPADMMDLLDMFDPAKVLIRMQQEPYSNEGYLYSLVIEAQK